MELIKLILCHLVGDYVLQNDFIANTKGKNLYHLFVHSALYCVPFMIFIDKAWLLLFLFLTHMIVDALKARYNKINYITDQLLHYIIIVLLIFFK